MPPRASIVPSHGEVTYRPAFAMVSPMGQHIIGAIVAGSSNMAAVQHVFGTPVDGHTYQRRRAVYAVIPNREGRVAAVRYRDNLFLPGGGIEAGESPEQALAREVEEECAQRVQIVEKIGEALQYFYAVSEDTYFAMQAIFYTGAFLGQTPGQAEYPVVWMFPDDKAPFFHASHLWAAQSLRREGNLSHVYP